MQLNLHIHLFYFPINYCWFQLTMAVKRELKVDAASQSPFFFVFGPTSLCTNAPSPKKIGDRKILFFFGREGAVVPRLGRLGPTRYGFSLLRVTEDEVLCRMQARVQLWQKEKGSRHLCHLSNPSHQSHLIILVTPVDKGNLVTLAILVTQLTIR